MMKKEDAESFLYKVDMEGLDYAVQNYAPKKTGDKKFNDIVSRLSSVITEMEKYIDEMREQYDIEAEMEKYIDEMREQYDIEEN